jgi:hypothetical protein
VPAINVLAELGTATWSAPQAVAYETALEGVGQAIGFYAELIGQEEAAADPDLAAIEGWRGQQHAWALRGRELVPGDVKAIESIYDDGEETLAQPVEDKTGPGGDDATGDNRG